MNRIKLLRKLKKMTQKELAEKANISRATLSKVENNLCSATLRTALLISNALEIKISDIFLD